MKTISFSLDAASIDRAIRELHAWREGIKEKCVTLRKRIAEEIRWSAEEGFKTAVVDDIILGYQEQNDVQVRVEHDDTVSVVIADGSQAVFIEFGAGVYHNGVPGDSPHPWGIENGFAIGTYGKGKGVRNVWGYKNEHGSINLTHGTPAAMPMYNGCEQAIRKLDELAREVFG